MSFFKKLTVSVLTHHAEGRLNLLKHTLETFLQSTLIPARHVTLNIHVNGDMNLEECMPDFLERLDQVFNLSITQSANNGPGYGLNVLAEKALEREYNLMLEGDWFTLPSRISNIGNAWLSTCLMFMEKESDIDRIDLRRYQHDVDHRQYMYANWFNSENIKSESRLEIDGHEYTLYHLRAREYTNPPNLQRIKRFYETTVYPLNVPTGSSGECLEVKGNPEWGFAEIDAGLRGLRLNTSYFNHGVFVHGDGIPVIESRSGCRVGWDSISSPTCGHYPKSGGCKYGFIRPRLEFCSCCSKSFTYSDLNRHNDYFEKVIVGEIGHTIPTSRHKEVKDLTNKRFGETEV